LRARKRRGYDGTWLPSPIGTSAELAAQAKLPDARYGELESVTFAFLVALEALTPTQRAVLLLRDVFDYSVREAADALGLSEANVKTTLHRARHAMEHYDAHALPPTPERIAHASEALRALFTHLFTRNVPALEALLSADVLARNDGGGEFHAARKIIAGRARVIRFHLRTLRYALGSVRVTLVNGSPALVADLPPSNPRLARRVVVRIETDANGKVARIDSIVATAKLTAIDFEASQRSMVGLFLEGMRSAALHPPPQSWLPAAARGLVRSTKARFGGRGHATKRR
ncbi:MAG: hypothetical protein H5U40_05225, partial [Polyangiaceae bacterium]|nr:hypothetical protein [Polyangiaceae bacterium]